MVKEVMESPKNVQYYWNKELNR